MNSAGKDAQNMLVVANDAVTAAKAEAENVLSDAKAAATSVIQQQLDDGDAYEKRSDQAVADVQTELKQAGAKSADNLADAVADAMKQADVSLAVIQADIEQIKDDISQIRAIATKNWIIKRLRVCFRMLICN